MVFADPAAAVALVWPLKATDYDTALFYVMCGSAIIFILNNYKMFNM